MLPRPHPGLSQLISFIQIVLSDLGTQHSFFHPNPSESSNRKTKLDVYLCLCNVKFTPRMAHIIQMTINLIFILHLINSKRKQKCFLSVYLGSFLL